MLHDVFSKSSYCFIRDWNNNDQLSHIIHDIHKDYITVIIGEVAWYPEISVKNCKTDRSWGHEFLISSVPFICQPTVWLLLYPFFNVYSNTWLEESKFQSVQLFLLPRMISSRLSMHGIKNNTSKRKRNNNATNMVGRNDNRLKINKSITNYTK